MITVKQHINKFKITVIIMSIIDDAIDYVKKIFENDFCVMKSMTHPTLRDYSKVN